MSQGRDREDPINTVNSFTNLDSNKEAGSKNTKGCTEKMKALFGLIFED